MNLPTDLHVTAFLRIHWRRIAASSASPTVCFFHLPFCSTPLHISPNNVGSSLWVSSFFFCIFSLLLSLWVTFHISCCLFHSFHCLTSSAPQLSSDGTAKVAYKTLACTWQLNSNRAGGSARTWRQATYLHPSALPFFFSSCICLRGKEASTHKAS